LEEAISLKGIFMCISNDWVSSISSSFVLSKQNTLGGQPSAALYTNTPIPTIEQLAGCCLKTNCFDRSRSSLTFNQLRTSQSKGYSSEMGTGPLVAYIIELELKENKHSIQITTFEHKGLKV